MTQRTKPPVPAPSTGTSPAPTPPTHPKQPTEPVEVLGRHKNSGQKDHKGAR